MIFEACVETLEQCVVAEKNGAHQLELCADLSQDGLTPPEELIKKVRQNVDIPVHVMIRPRDGDFCYSDAEFETMKKSIEMCKTLLVAGVVFGILNKNNEVDIQRTRFLAQFSKPLTVTFHKAIDFTPDPLKSAMMLDNIEEIDQILTSGGAPTAKEGVEILKKMVDRCKRVQIKAAGKITFENREGLAKLTGCQLLHGTKIVT